MKTLRRLARAAFLGPVGLWLWMGSATAQFAYEPPGALVSGSGQGRVDYNVYAPGILFPIEQAPAFLNSQVWGVGGSHGPSGSQCDARNFSYPWHDNYCETRQWTMPLCPAGQGHQGQDIRASSCQDDHWWVVAATDGTITNIGSYSVYLTAGDGKRYDYLHMRSVAVRLGQHVRRGDRLGRVSNNFGGTPTSIHLHFNIRMNVAGLGSVYVPTYLSLVQAYEDLVGPACTPHCEGSVMVQSNCARGDCSAYGATCIDDALGLRCVYEVCPARGEADVCLDPGHISHCVDGIPQTPGDCGAFASFCSTAGRGPYEARCHSAFCVSDASQVPVAHDTCWLADGALYHCDDRGQGQVEACPTGTACSVIGGSPHCAAPACPASGELEICVDDRYVAGCLNGSIVRAEDCSLSGARCVLGADALPRCEVQPEADAGTPADAGPEPDAGHGDALAEDAKEPVPTLDAGHVDAAVPEPEDAGAGDVSSTTLADASVPPRTPLKGAVGAGCRCVSPDGRGRAWEGLAVFFLATFVVGLGRRRRPCSRRPSGLRWGRGAPRHLARARDPGE